MEKCDLDSEVIELMLSICVWRFVFFRMDQDRFFGKEIHIDLKHSKI